jgi:hypothetical protein
MTVRELIERLREYHPDAVCVVSDGDGGTDETFYVEGRPDEAVEWPVKHRTQKMWPKVWIGV